MALGAKEIVLGLGGTVDYEVEWDAGVFEALVAEEGITSSDLNDVPEITSQRDLLISVLNFFAAGGSGERFVVDPEIIHQLARRFRYATTLGGTPVRAAMVMALRGVASTVHLVSTNEPTRRLLPPGTLTISSATKDTLFPHFIVQYPQGATIRLVDTEVVAPRANRLIYTHDPDNEELLLSDKLGDALSGARLFLVSGLNIFREEVKLRERLSDLLAHMGALLPSATVVYEDAGFHKPDYSAIVRDALIPSIDVYSMNEDEAQERARMQIDLSSGGEVVALCERLIRELPIPAIMIHTHRWAAIVGERAADYREALNAAVQMSAGRYRFGDSMTTQQLASVSQFPVRSDALSIERTLKEYFGRRYAFTPGFEIDVDRPTTIGLGDSFIGGFLAQLALDGS